MHGAIRHAAGNYLRLEGLSGVKEYVHQQGAFLLQQGVELYTEIISGQTEGGKAETFRNPCEVRKGYAAKWAGTKFPPKKVLLRLSDGRIAVVVKHKNKYGQLVLGDGLQFLNIHHDTTIAFQTYDAPGGMAHACPDSGGQGKAHSAVSMIAEQSLSASKSSCLQWNDAGGSVAHNDAIIRI